jgi:hypothetical protein
MFYALFQTNTGECSIYTHTHTHTHKYIYSAGHCSTLKKEMDGISNYHILFHFFNCCAGWGYIVAFTKVLTMYQIHHT